MKEEQLDIFDYMLLTENERFSRRREKSVVSLAKQVDTRYRNGLGMLLPWEEENDN